MQIRFLSDQTYDTGGPGKGPKFAAGSILRASDVGKTLGVDVTQAWAEGFLARWVRRNVAEYVDAKAKAEPVAEVAQPIAEPVAEPKPAIIPDEKVSTVQVGEAKVSAPIGTARRGG